MIRACQKPDREGGQHERRINGDRWKIALAYARASDTQPLEYRLRDL